MKKRTLYFTSLAAYLTGWPIVQLVYNRIWKRVMDRDGESWAEGVAFKAIEKYEEVARPPQRSYPFTDGDVTVLGPEVFIDRDDEVISHRGVNYYRSYHRAGAETRPLPPTRL